MIIQSIHRKLFASYWLRISNGASNACVYTKATVQAMPLFPQTRKTISFPLREADGFLLVEAPAPSPGEHKVFWVTIRSGPATRLKIAQKTCRRRKSRDKSTVKFGCLTHNGITDKLYANILSIIGFQKCFHRKSLILVGMPCSCYDNDAPAVWHFERSA